MWKYNHTNEMFTNNSSKLYHSDTYLGQDYSDGIRHYKYLKKVKTASGKWRYIYDESELKNAQKEIDALHKVRTGLSTKDGYLKYVDKNGDHVSKHKDGYTITVRGNSKQSIADKAKEKLDATIAKKEKAHATQKLKDIPKRLISKGIGFVNKLLMKAEKNWTKR